MNAGFILKGLEAKYREAYQPSRFYPVLRFFSLSQALLRYVVKFRKPIHLQKPRDLNEKLLWLAIHKENFAWTILADKVAVHQYLKALGLENLSVPIIRKWERAEDIDFDYLPSSFVIKTNHGCGDVIVVHDKATVNEVDIKNRMSKYLKRHFGLLTGEPHYLNIKPYLFAEKILVNDSAVSSSIIDYKFFCFNGVPRGVLVCYDRHGLHAEKMFYDMDWTLREDLTNISKNAIVKDIPKPSTFDTMVNACNLLGNPFPFVRIDFYESEGKTYFGEMTFTPAAGRSTALTQKGLDLLGSYIDCI